MVIHQNIIVVLIVILTSLSCAKYQISSLSNSKYLDIDIIESLKSSESYIAESKCIQEDLRLIESKLLSQQVSQEESKLRISDKSGSLKQARYGN